MKRIILCLWLIYAPVVCFSQQVMPAMGSTWSGGTSGCAGFCIQKQAYGISSAAATSISAGAMTGVISGHTLLAFVRDGQTGSTITCSDTLGNTWVNLTSSSFAGIGTIQWCYSENITGGGSDIVSAAVTSGTFVTIQVYECGGASLTSPIDLNAVKTFFGSVYLDFQQLHNGQRTRDYLLRNRRRIDSAYAGPEWHRRQYGNADLYRNNDHNRNEPSVFWWSICVGNGVLHCQHGSDY